MAQYDTQSVYDFLVHTPEGALRKMLVDKVKMTDVHLSLLVKVVRASTQSTFDEHFSKQDFPKIRMSDNETKIKERFWGDCTAMLLERGLLQPMTTMPKAA